MLLAAVQSRGLKHELAALARDNLEVSGGRGRRSRLALHSQQGGGPAEAAAAPSSLAVPSQAEVAASAAMEDASLAREPTSRDGSDDAPADALQTRLDAAVAPGEAAHESAEPAESSRAASRPRRGAAVQAASAIARQAASNPASEEQLEDLDADAPAASQPALHANAPAIAASAGLNRRPAPRSPQNGKAGLCLPCWCSHRISLPAVRRCMTET